MGTQRRYSVTGQTPPDAAEAMKARSPKLQALDTGVAPASCGLCERCDGAAEASTIMATASDDGAAEAGRGRRLALAQAGTGSALVRTSSKRSATQLPSPTSPTQCLPPKMARYRLADAGADHGARPLGLEPDVPRLEQLQLCAAQDDDNHHHHHGRGHDDHDDHDDQDDDDNDGMDDFALSPTHSRTHSLDRILQDDDNDDYDTHPPPPHRYASHPPVTLLTLPPEIRHHIYRNCDNIVLHKPLVYCISTFNGEMQHPLASVSRLVRAEALAIFYSYNLWVIKVEFRIMYDAFQDWIIRLGPGARLLRLVSFSVRGALFKPWRAHTQTVVLNGQPTHVTPGAAAFDNLPTLYSPPDGDASFHIDLSEKFIGGKVELVRNDGTTEAGEKATAFLRRLVQGLWEKRRAGTLNGQDWISMVDGFISFVCGW
ncbi:hypothetical protein T440DRAFT_221138 [Plenodomus tracheiphilus IPT5]|uniref:F-box domain-containing protein n=1 Tax=Plenodomus tracheiphilus IPT5 TaxID=1408161 RepID=A0A6A7AWX2_9PLEO|nr:hypothetical protein T440DRAFT_221138 [Plenodomus tracheiphilus IPT5]